MVNYLPDPIVFIYGTVNVQPLQYVYIWVDVDDRGKVVVESNYNNKLSGNIYRHYNLERSKQEGYRCTCNCHFLECKQ